MLRVGGAKPSEEGLRGWKSRWRAGMEQAGGGANQAEFTAAKEGRTEQEVAVHSKGAKGATNYLVISVSP
jgi:hypothetical protein